MSARQWSLAFARRVLVPFGRLVLVEVHVWRHAELSQLDSNHNLTILKLLRLTV